MKILNDAMKVAKAPTARINWSEECVNACIELHEHIVNQPLAFWSPFDLINDDNCLVSMTDAIVMKESLDVCLWCARLMPEM